MADHLEAKYSLSLKFDKRKFIVLSFYENLDTYPNELKESYVYYNKESGIIQLFTLDKETILIDRASNIKEPINYKTLNGFNFHITNLDSICSFLKYNDNAITFDNKIYKNEFEKSSLLILK